jgi:ABC-type branched-subunit amino acid transport system ATPase component
VRDNEPAARALGLPAPLVRLQAFAVGGALAGFAGALLAQALFRINPATFSARASIDVVAMTVVGGLAIIGGPLLGALYIVALPALVELSSAALAATTFGWLTLVLAVPGGLASLGERLRRQVVALLLRASGHDAGLAYVHEPAPVWPVAAPSARGARSDGRPPGDDPDAPPALELSGLVRHFGGVAAVDGVSIAVRPGEAVGLVGPNGAGKTSVLDLACGLERLDAGTVRIDGRDVGSLTPELRAARGLARSFQDAALFPTLTVREVVSLGLERREPSRLLVGLSGWSRDERAKRARAQELLGLLGLQAYADAPVHVLSTGLRRVTELACMLAFEPRVLLLDEPSSGLAQPEVGALGRLLRRVRAELAPAMVLVEHDLALVAELVDRVVVMAGGRIVAEGPPALVHADRRVGGLLGLASLPATSLALQGEGAR